MIVALAVFGFILGLVVFIGMLVLEEERPGRESTAVIGVLAFVGMIFSLGVLVGMFIADGNF